MKMFKLINCLIIMIIFALLVAVKTDSVCDLNTLLIELKQDLADNGMLDCLRVIEPPHFVEETEDQKNLRLAAQWDTSCAFESSSNWKKEIKKLGISSLVDSVGEVVQNDYDDQADMCEIVRAAVAANVFNIPDLNMQKLPDDLLDKIDCAGISNIPRYGPRICAATGGSYFQQDSWTILLDTASIKLGGKPNFVPSIDQTETKENPYSNQANPIAQNKLIKDLMKFSNDQLDLKEGELANMIDKAEQNEKNNDEKEKNKEKNEESSITKNAHVHTKKLNDVQFTASTDDKFMLVDGATAEFNVPETRLVFGFYMASFRMEKPGNAYFKLNYAGREMAESRMPVGNATVATLTSGFAEVYDPKGEQDKVKLEVLYNTQYNAKVQTGGGEENFSFGALTLPEGSVFKKTNSANLEFHKSAKWNVISNFDLTINHHKKKDAYYFIMFNLGFPLPGTFTLETRLKVGKSSLTETSAVCGPTNIIGLHSGIVIKIQPGTSLVSAEYKYDGDSLTIQDFTDSRYSQSFTAFELPENTVVKNYKISKPVVLNTNGEWRGMGFDATLELSKKQTVLILYNINLRVDDAYFSARVRVDTVFKRKSTFAISDQTFAFGQGYVASIMKPGKYNLDIDFKSNSKNTFNPETVEVDGQVANLQIILLD